MITHKSTWAKKPYSRKWFLRKRHLYLFPQRWTWSKSVAEISYQSDDIYKHTNFWLIYKYQFSWLFIDMIWEIKTEFLSQIEKRHEPIKHVSPDGDIFPLM